MIEKSLGSESSQLVQCTMNIIMWIGKYHILPKKANIWVISIDKKTVFLS